MKLNTVLGLVALIALALVWIPPATASTPGLANFLGSGLTTGGLTALALNLVLPSEDREKPPVQPSAGNGRTQI